MNSKAKAILFNSDEIIGFKDSASDYKPVSNEHLQFFCLNPLKTFDNLNKLNVAKYRNILIEFDKLQLSQQDHIVEKARLPFSVKTFSGNKSYHYIISLTQAMTAEEYEELVDAIYMIFPQADKACKNANRLSRTPGAIRVDNKNEQKLKAVNERISVASLWNWIKETHKLTYLNFLAHKKLKSQKEQKLRELVDTDASIEPCALMDEFFPSWKRLLENGAAQGDRHSTAVNLATAMVRCGFEHDFVEAAIANFLLKSGKSTAHSEAHNITRWAFQNVVPLVF